MLNMCVYACEPEEEESKLGFSDDIFEDDEEDEDNGEA